MPVYRGPTPPDRTDTQTRPTPVVREWVSTLLHPGDTALDIGAGRHARNADYLRGCGVQVYAYDPLKGDPCVTGWAPHEVSSVPPPPDTVFRLVYSTYVLNTVTVQIEDEILGLAASYGAPRRRSTLCVMTYVTWRGGRCSEET